MSFPFRLTVIFSCSLVPWIKSTNAARSKTRKPRKSWKFFSEIFKSEFSILPYSQNQKLGNKKTRNTISEICESSITHFFIFQNFFSIFLTKFIGCTLINHLIQKIELSFSCTSILIALKTRIV